MADNITLTVGGTVYEGWKDIRITRAIEHCAADFEISVSERWAGQSGDPPWQIKPFDPCTVAVDGELLITGYVDHYGPSYDARGHGVRIGGRSKTCDIIDCMPDIPGGQFVNYKLDKIARAVCSPFGVNVVVTADVGDAIPDAMLEKAETAYEFLEKLCGLQGVLAFDDEKGNLVLAQAGASSASGALTEGQNILAASAELRSDIRFQKYVVLAQAPLAFDEQDSQLQVIGTASDPGCPRFRRFVESAQNPADTSRANRRAQWRALRNFGACTQATVLVEGWRQPDGSLWKINQLISVKSPRLQIDRQMLVGRTVFTLSEQGSRTELLVAPPEAYTPEPPKSKKPKNGSSSLWSF